MCRQQCSGCIYMITNINPEDGGSAVFETLVSTLHITRHNNPENHDFYLLVNFPFFCV
jgi:hypothetical protein